MPGPNAWMSIPTTILDLGQKTADAESWAAAQRAQLAETWANVQRQAVQTMADTYQRGTDTLDHFTGGYQGAQDGATGPTAPPGYNDMAGASSSPGTPAFGSNPEDVTSPIDQARNVVGASSSPSPFTSDWPSVTVPSANPAPQPLPQLLGGDQPLTDIGNQIVQGQRNRTADQRYAMTPTLGTRADQPAREQVAPTVNPADIRAGFTPSQQQAQFDRAANIAMGSTGIEKVGAPSVVGEGKPFYSALAQAIETKVQPRGTVEQAKAALVNAGVKPIEMAITGLDDYLASKAAGAKVTRTELQDFVAKNALDVREVVKGTRPVQDQEQQRLEAFARRTNHPEDWQAYEQHMQDYGPAQSTKYSGYVTPGADPGSYRELLLTTPKADPAGAAYDFRKSLTDKYGDGIMNKATPEEIQQLNTLDRAAQAPAPASYQSSHYDEPNILAHVRFNARTDASGAKVLHVEEIQSDWAQAGRKNPGSVPPTPFANTSDWAGLAFKRVLRYAADNGYDKVTWTTGAQQNARYSLAQRFDSIHYEPSTGDFQAIKAGQLPTNHNVTSAELPDLVGQDAAKRLLASPADDGWHSLSGPGLQIGGSGMKGFYDTILPSVADKIGKKFGARTGEGAVHTTTMVTPPGPGIVAGGGLPSMAEFRANAQPGETFADYVQRTIKTSTPRTDTLPVHSFTIPPAMKASVQKGQTLYTPPAVGGAIVGGLAGATQPAQTPQERAKNIAMGAAAGGVGAYGLQKLGENGNLGRLTSDESGMIGRAPKATAPGEERAGNILLRKFDPGVQDVIAEAAAKDPAAMEAARRGVVSDQTVQDLAQAAGTTVNKVIARWKPGDIANAETITAMKSALQSKAQEASDLAKTAVATPSAANDLNLALAVHEQNAIQAAVSGGTAELGRGLRALRASVQDAIQSGQPEQMQAVLKRMGGPEWTADLAKKLTQIDPTDAQARYDFLRNALKPQLKDYLTELWYSAMLSGPHTFLVKSLSEATSLALSPVERGLSALADVPLSALQNRPRARFVGEVPANIVGMTQGIRDGAAKGLYLMQHGYSEADITGSDYVRRQAFKGPVGAVINAPTRLLAAGAEVAGTIAKSGALNANAYRTAKMEGLSGQALTARWADLLQTPTRSMLEAARHEGQYRVYQAEPGPWLKTALDLRNKDVLGLPVGRILIPFAQTPANLVKFGLERSPLGILKVLDPTFQKALAAGDPEVADRVGRWALGSMIAMAAGLAVGAGDITGAAPTNPSERDAWARQGKQPFSLKIGNNWVSYQKIEPLNQTLSQVAAAVDAANSGGDASAMAGQAIATIGANLASQSYMQSLSNALAAFKDPARGMALFSQGLASSTVPAALRTVAQVQDPTLRQVRSMPEAMQADIPGLSQQLPPTLNAFGEPRQRETSPISPVSISPSHIDPVDVELAKYGVEPGLTGKTLRGIDLTREESAAHQRISGQLVKQKLTSLVNSAGYQQLSDTAKARALTLTISHAKDAAANRYLAQLIQQQGKAAIVGRIQQKKLQRLPKAG